MSNITVAALLASEGEDSNSTTSYVVKNEEGQLVNVEYSHRERYYGEVTGEGTNTILNPDGSSTTVFSEAGIGLDHFSDSSQGVPDLEYQPQTFSQGHSQAQDLVSMALESSKVGEVQEGTWGGGGSTQEQLLGDDRGEVETEQEGGGEEFPDEIECQLIQKNVLMNGQIQTIDFIMCNQCPRLFRTESLLWNHIKAKHKRRSYRRASTLGQVRRQPRLEGGGLEPGEIQERSHLRTEVVGEAVSGPQQHNRSPSKATVSNVRSPPNQGQHVKKEPVYIVGLDKSGSKGMIGEGFDRSRLPVERYQRQRARKRIYVDSNTGPFKCPGCDIVTFSNRRSLDLHMKRVHKAGIVECDECGRKVLDLKRHKEILHKRFKIYECPHCPDKYCTREDLERHLVKVEKNNMVQGEKINTGTRLSTPAQIPDEETFDSDADDDEPVVDTQEMVKQMEAKTFSCSECGLKTPSRMTYIQHVLNGCIMDMVLGENGGEGEGLVDSTPAKRGRKPNVESARKRQMVGGDE